MNGRKYHPAVRPRIPPAITRLHVRSRAAADLARVSRTAVRAYGGHPVAVVRRMRWLRRSEGFGYREALELGLLDPGMSRRECARYVSRHVNLSAQRRLNGHDEPALVTDKLVFQRYCEAIGLPVPRMVAVVYRESGSWTLPGRSLPLEACGTEALPDSFVVKPCNGYEGYGVQLLHKAGGDRLLHHDGRATTLPELLRELRGHREFESWIVQERETNHPVLAGLAGAETLHTIRFITLIDHDGRPELLWTGMRLGLSRGPADNFHGGAFGNAFCTVDSRTGVLGDAGWIRAGGLGVETGPVVPGSGVRTTGVALPHWEDAVEMVMRASPAFLPVRSIGWDIGLTPTGPIVIEANTNWGAAAVPGMRAVVARLEEQALVRRMV